jgi:putative membrane protein
MTAIVTLAHARPGWWLFFPLFWVGVWVVLVAFFWRRRRGWWAGQGRMPAEAVLGERYARGEITDAEYRERLAVLRERPGA